MAAYDENLDKILWESEPINFKPQATVKAQVKQYKDGIPKLLLVEEGIGYGNKAYSGYILKRIELERIDIILDLLTKGKAGLEEVLKGVQSTPTEM